MGGFRWPRTKHAAVHNATLSRRSAPPISCSAMIRRSKPARPAQKPGAATGAGTGEVFDLVGGPEPDDSPAAAPAPPIPSGPPRAEAKRPREASPERAKQERQPDPADLVQEVWSRKAEWGMTLLVVGVWATFIVFIVYFVLGLDHIGPSLLTLIMGGLVAAVLSYPIWITMERPVRVTPEQAVRDFYRALSHHLPHYRRMWLLLSSAGRISTAYGSFQGFKRYWRQCLGRLRRPRRLAHTARLRNRRVQCG